MRPPRYFLLVLVALSLFTPVGYAQTDVPYINPPVIYDYTGDSDSTSDAVTEFTPDSEALYIKVIGFNPSGTETHLIEVWSPAGELYFSEGFGAGGSGWSGDFGDYMIETRMPIKNTDAADMNGWWDVIVYFQTGAGIAGPDSYSDKRVSVDAFFISIRELGRREIWVDEVIFDEEVAPGETVNVDVNVGWIFDATTDIIQRIYNNAEGVYEVEVSDTVGSEASKTYSLELTAPMTPGDYDYAVEVPYLLNGEWFLADGASSSFIVTVVSENETGGEVGGDPGEGDIEDIIRNVGIPGFPPLALYLGLSAIALILNTKPRKHH